MADSTILALDIGEKRIGVARANSIALIAEPLITLTNNDEFFDKLSDLIDEHKVSLLIIGSPKNLNDNPTEQTRYTHDFAKKIAETTKVPILFQNEALSSVTAKDRLARDNRKHDKSDIDSAAAAVILDTFIESNMDRIKHLA